MNVLTPTNDHIHVIFARKHLEGKIIFVTIAIFIPKKSPSNAMNVAKGFVNQER